MLPHGFFHLDDAQGFGVAEHLHILEALEGIGEDIPLGFLIGVAALGENTVLLFDGQVCGSAGFIEPQKEVDISISSITLHLANAFL